MSAAPTELALAGLDPSRFHKVGPNEYHGPCLRCGGKDRFVVWTNRPFPAWGWMCRVCHPEYAWLDQLNPKLRVPLTPEQRAEYAAEQARREKERQQALAKKLQEFTTAELWDELHRRMGESQRQWWENRGIPSDWQDYLQLGYTPDKIYNVDDALYHSPAYTIPYLRPAGPPVTMQYRLTDPKDPGDKYRFEPGLPPAWYNPDPMSAIGDQVIICEGAIKAMVTQIRSGLHESHTVLAVPSKNSWAGIVEQVRECGRVWVVLDPDGEKYALNLAQEIGKAARVVYLPEKIDDAINGGLTTSELQQYFRQARRN